MTPQALWEQFQARTASPADSHRGYTAWYFCDNEHDANTLVDLVLAGIKTATASVWELYALEAEPVPCVGDYSVVTNWSGEACCVIRTTNVCILPFQEVPESFAFKEGEGDRSLSYWRKVHTECFEREMAGFELKLNEHTRVVCEEFELLYPESA